MFSVLKISYVFAMNEGTFAFSLRTVGFTLIAWVSWRHDELDEFQRVAKTNLRIFSQSDKQTPKRIIELLLWTNTSHRTTYSVRGAVTLDGCTTYYCIEAPGQRPDVSSVDEINRDSSEISSSQRDRLEQIKELRGIRWWRFEQQFLRTQRSCCYDGYRVWVVQRQFLDSMTINTIAVLN